MKKTLDQDATVNTFSRKQLSIFMTAKYFIILLLKKFKIYPSKNGNFEIQYNTLGRPYQKICGTFKTNILYQK